MKFKKHTMPPVMKVLIEQAIVGNLTRRGRKVYAHKLLLALKWHIKTNYKNSNPLAFLEELFEEARPKVMLIPKRLGSVTYKIPTPLPYHKSFRIVIRWFTNAARKRKGKPMFVKLLEELDDLASNNKSNLVLKRRDEYHKWAHLNRPFIHFARF